MPTETATVIRDLSCCEPTGSLSKQPKPGCWRMVDYQTEDGIARTMSFAAPEDEAGQVVLPLNVRGALVTRIRHRCARQAEMGPPCNACYPIIKQALRSQMAENVDS